jgi:hypothetical protein
LGARTSPGANSSASGWPDHFAAPILSKTSKEPFGWTELASGASARQPQLCRSAFLKIVALDALEQDQKIYERHCRSQSPSLLFGLHGLRYVAAKSNLPLILRKYDPAVAKELLPLTFDMSKSADCRRLFALRSRNASSWLVKHDQGFGGDGVSFQPSIAHLERSLGGCDQSPAKSAAKPAAKSAAKSAAKPAAKSAAKSAAKPRGKPLVQELVPIRLLDGKAWNLRVYLLVVSLRPLRAFRRLGNVKRCVEPFSKRFSGNALTRDLATKCNLHSAKRSPKFGQSGFQASDVMAPIPSLAEELGSREYGQLLLRVDHALGTLARAIAPYLSQNASGTSHSVQLLAVDALWTERGHVKILEIEPNPAHSSDLSMPTDETHGTPHATDLLQTALTSFCQFGMRDQRCDVNACARDFDMLQAVV